MSVSVSMPQLGESVTEGTVTRWLKKEGERVEVDEPLLEVSTDKVDTEIPSPASGILRGIAVDEDETVAVGAQLAVIEDSESGDAAPAADDSASAEAAEPASPTRPSPRRPSLRRPSLRRPSLRRPSPRPRSRNRPRRPARAAGVRSPTMRRPLPPHRPRRGTRARPGLRRLLTLPRPRTASPSRLPLTASRAHRLPPTTSQRRRLPTVVQPRQPRRRPGRVRPVGSRGFGRRPGRG